MDCFQYVNGELHAEDVPLRRIAMAVGTPFYCYSGSMIQHRALEYVRAFSGMDALVCYAVKANANPHLLKLFAAYGLGADIVSGGELRLALQAGIPANRLVFSGVGKTAAELSAALKAGILQINVESAEELRALDGIASKMGVVASVALRVNPDVDADTHHKITTGTLENKFGINWQDIPALLFEAGNMAGVNVVGLAVHIGSQITSIAPYEKAYQRVAGMVQQLQAEGYTLKRLDLGGGIGIRYTSENAIDIADYAAMVKKTLGHLKMKLVFEPGRSVIGAAGVLVGQVIYTKKTGTRDFAILDAGMNDLLRPAMYDAVHRILPVQASAATAKPYDVVGPVCESSDVFGTDIPLPPLRQGQLLAIMDSGAYGSVMGSTYNWRPPAPEVLVVGNKFAVIRKRLSYDEMNLCYPATQWQT
jgi:diaminopimelate decarboxylase